MLFKSKLTAVALFITLALAACAPVQQESLQVELQFVTHPTASMPEQDVYIQGDVEGEVVRAQLEETEQYMDAPVFATTKRIEHDPLVLGETDPGAILDGKIVATVVGGRVVYRAD